jgi:hypothetical protein
MDTLRRAAAYAGEPKTKVRQGFADSGRAELIALYARRPA